MAIQKSDYNTWDTAKKVLFAFNIFYWVVGLGCFAVGLWLNIDKYPRSYFLIMSRNSHDEALPASTVMLIVAGIVMFGMGFLGFFAAKYESKQLLLIYIVLTLAIMVMELTIGFLVVKFRHDFHRDLKEGMVEQLHDDYGPNGKIGGAWDYLQVRKRCCGVDGSIDYRYSDWWWDVNGNVESWESAGIHVPDTCCKLEFGQDRDVSEVNPDDANPQDRERCNYDARGSADMGSSNLHNQGCYIVMYHNARKYMMVLLVFGLCIGFIQLFIMIASLYFLMTIDSSAQRVKGPAAAYNIETKS